MTILIIVLFMVAVIFFIWFLLTYNDLISLHNNVIDSIQKVNIQLNRRAQIIPQFLTVVKKVMKKEKKSFDDLEQVKEKVLNAASFKEKVEESMELTEKLSRFYILIEAYKKELYEMEEFLSLEEELKEIEEDIIKARELYNKDVKAYNHKIKQFPNVLVTKLHNFKEEQYMIVEKEGKDPLKIIVKD